VLIGSFGVGAELGPEYKNAMGITTYFTCFLAFEIPERRILPILFLAPLDVIRGFL
jgi:hypothetical protein